MPKEGIRESDMWEAIAQERNRKAHAKDEREDKAVRPAAGGMAASGGPGAHGGRLRRKRRPGFRHLRGAERRSRQEAGERSVRRKDQGEVGFRQRDGTDGRMAGRRTDGARAAAGR